MDTKEDAWSKLPEDVVSKILARLPLRSLGRSRAVCRAWNDKISSPAFVQERLESRGGAREGLLLVVGYGPNGCEAGVKSWAYDPASDSWYKFKLSRLLEREDIELRRPCVSAGGSLLLSGRSVWSVEAEVTIANPVASSWASLPAIPGDLQVGDVRGMLVNAAARRFKLVAVKEMSRYRLALGRPIQTFVFDSASWSWSVTETISSALQLPETETFDFPPGQAGQGVFVGTVLYCLSQTFNLLAYDMERGAWSCLAVAKPLGFVIYFCNLVKVRERLLCVAFGENLDPPRQAIDGLYLQVLELDFARMTWTVLPVQGAKGAEMPPLYWFLQQRPPLPFSYSELFRTRYPDSMKVVAGQDQIHIMFDHQPEGVALDLRQTPAIWRWYSSCPKKWCASRSFHCLDPWLDFGSWKPELDSDGELEDSYV